MEPVSAQILLRGLAAEGACLSDEEITLVTTDSRAVRPGCVFVAFRGEHFDGNAYAAQAVQAGAHYVVVNHPVADVPTERQLVCPDSLRAMMTIGANYRALFHPKTVGITGSVGKTTTKQMCFAAIEGFGNTIMTEGSQNNELGLPRTMLRIGQKTEYAVIEMGMNHAGEIERLAKCARPDVGVITCIGTSHIGNLGSRENICKAKLEICAGLPEGAPLVLNGDDAYLRAAALPAHVRPVWFALDDVTADVTARDIAQEGDSIHLTICDRAAGSYPVVLPTMGRHNAADALAAYTAATRLGLDPARAAEGLANFRQTGLRQKRIALDGVDYIADCYNANPDSMRAALAMFGAYSAAHRFAVLGDMLELGELSEQFHREIGRLAAHSGLDALVTYGPESEAMGQAAQAEAPALPVLHAATHAEAAALLRERAKPGDAVLLKASHGMHLEKILELLGWREEP